MNEKKKILGALRFLTIFNFPGDEELKGASAYFPLVGWLIGGILYLFWTFIGALPTLVEAILIIFIWEFLSRGFHIDALADSADALMAGGSKERILEIMEDSKICAFGVLAIVVLILGKFSLISSNDWESVRAALVCAPVLSRYFITLSAFIFKPAKDKGLGQIIVSTTGVKEILIATLVGYLPAVIVFQRAALYSTVAFVLPFFLLLYLQRKLGGITGDIMGAAIEITEFIILFLFLPIFYT